MRLLPRLRHYRNTVVVTLALLGFAYVLWQFPTLMTSLAHTIYAAEIWLILWRWGLILGIAIWWPQLIKATGAVSPSTATSYDHYTKNLGTLRWRVVGALVVIELVFCMDIISKTSALFTT